jgi:hypothetical protein
MDVKNLKCNLNQIIRKENGKIYAKSIEINEVINRRYDTKDRKVYFYIILIGSKKNFYQQLNIILATSDYKISNLENQVENLKAKLKTIKQENNELKKKCDKFKPVNTVFKNLQKQDDCVKKDLMVYSCFF